MASSGNIYLWIGTYPEQATAVGDFQLVWALRDVSGVGDFDAAVVVKDARQKLHVVKHESGTERAAWGGAAVGAILGILFPPFFVADIVLGAAAAAVGAHLWTGLSRHDVKELGELIDSGEAALLAIGGPDLEAALGKLVLSPASHIARHVDARVEGIHLAVEEVARR